MNEGPGALPGGTGARGDERFAHHSERQFARLLDFYQIDWLYEPTTFDIAWNSVGEPTQRFSPDFYLPEFDLYIEITTLNQKLVTRKNRKVRRLNELYPDVKCKILYQRDYVSLVMKYGLDDGDEVHDEDAVEAPGERDIGTWLAG
jgi:hypothetical protein